MTPAVEVDGDVVVDSIVDLHLDSGPRTGILVEDDHGESRSTQVDVDVRGNLNVAVKLRSRVDVDVKVQVNPESLSRPPNTHDPLVLEFPA